MHFLVHMVPSALSRTLFQIMKKQGVCGFWMSVWFLPRKLIFFDSLTFLCNGKWLLHHISEIYDHLTTAVFFIFLILIRQVYPSLSSIQFSQKAFQGINWFSTSKNLLNRMKLQEDVILCFFSKASFHFRIHFHAIFSAKEALLLQQIVRGNVTLLLPENCFMALYKLHNISREAYSLKFTS